MGLEPNDPTRERSDEIPTGMKLVAAYYVVNAVYLLLVAGEVFGIGGTAALLGGGLIAFVGAVGLASAYGLVTGTEWGYTLAILIAAVSLLISILTVSPGGLLMILVLYYLSQNDEVYESTAPNRQRSGAWKE